MEKVNLLINNPTWVEMQEQKVLDSWKQHMLSEQVLALGTPSYKYPGNLEDLVSYPMNPKQAISPSRYLGDYYSFDEKQRAVITDIYKDYVHFGMRNAVTEYNDVHIFEFRLPDTPIMWSEVPRLMVDCGFPIEQFNNELAKFITGVNDPKIPYVFSNKLCNAFIKASGITFKGDQRVPTSKDPLDPEVKNNMVYHELMTNYKQVKAMPLAILCQMFIEDHKEYEIVEHSLHVVGPIKYNVLGADLNEVQRTKVISRILNDWHLEIKKLETPSAIEYHAAGGYIPNFNDSFINPVEYKWEIDGRSSMPNGKPTTSYSVDHGIK